MSESMKPYPEYKDSGVPWLGKIPAHWDVLRCKYVFREIDERSIDGLETHLSMSQKHGLIPSDRLEGKHLRSESYAGGKLCQSNDLVLNRLKAHLGVFAVAGQPGVISPDYTVLRPLDARSVKYFESLLKTPPCVAELRRSTKGVVEGFWRLYTDDFYNITVPVPPPDEQAAIVRFLDVNAALVRQFIRNRRRLIEVLTEQQQAIINRAVTRGLDPSVKLKPSGVDWLGDVPVHWLKNRFKSVVQIRSGQVNPTDTQYADNTLIAPEHIEKGTGKILCLETARDQNAISGKYFVERGEVIYSKIRPALRKAAIAPIDCLCSADMYPLKPKPTLVPQYLLCLLLLPTTTKYLVDCSMRVAMPKVNRETLGSLPLCYPPKDEQEAILDHIRMATAPIEKTIKIAIDEIRFISEYRSKLITNVVIGDLNIQSVVIESLDLAENDCLSIDALDEPELDEELAHADD